MTTGERKLREGVGAADGGLRPNAAAVFWAVLFERWVGERRLAAVLPSVQDALAMSAFAAAVDYGATPKRFTPGWEFVPSKRSMAHCDLIKPTYYLQRSALDNQRRRR